MGKIYTLEGKIFDFNKMYKGNHVFEKITSKTKEKLMCKILMDNPHQNVVKIYEIESNFIDMELLDVNLAGIKISEIKEVMQGVKYYLQRLGIMYIDWKLDNIGMSADGNLKLFDFDSSGMIDINTGEWIKNAGPSRYYSYTEAINAGMKTPIEIDNYAFEIGFF